MKNLYHVSIIASEAASRPDFWAVRSTDVTDSLSVHSLTLAANSTILA